MIKNYTQRKWKVERKEPEMTDSGFKANFTGLKSWFVAWTKSTRLWRVFLEILQDSQENKVAGQAQSCRPDFQLY